MDEMWTRVGSDLIARVSGPMKFRLVLQPAMAAFLAIRAGLADARAGRRPYFWTLVSDPAQRAQLAMDGLKSVGKVFALAVVLDVIYQIVVSRFVYPGEAILVAVILAIVPYLILRGLITRLDTRSQLFLPILVALTALAAPGGPVWGSQVTRPATPPADGGWPRAYTTATGGRIVLYQPQVASWPGQKHMTLYAAVSYQARDAGTPTLGTIKVEADTSVAVAERLVNFSAFTIAESTFPSLSRDQLRTVTDELTTSIPREERVIALDRVLANMDLSEVQAKNVDRVKADAPIIFASQTPAVLVNLDGDAVWSPIEQSDLKFAVNTNWDLFQQGSSNTYFLRVDKAWLKSSALDEGWKPAGGLPSSFAALPNDGDWTAVKAALPGQPVPASQAPTVFVSTKPAELIVLRGTPAYKAVTGTRLQWVSNTDGDLFRLGTNGAFYYLISGRWFSAPRLAGPWTFATTNLPDDFKKIPLDHPRSRVLASVPGTPQALEAVLLAQIPQTATVSRASTQASPVSYQGAPQFEAIGGTPVARAVNTDKDILRVGDRYYMCFQGVWFTAATPSGSWQVADVVPLEIYEIPIDSPAYSVTYVTVESSTPDAVVFAASPAYSGLMVAWGTAVWGTGWYYPPYIGLGGAYPVYYPHYPTYGYGASYNPWSGAYTRAAGVAYGPYGGAGYAARYNPSTGTYARGAVAWGPYGATGAAQAWNPRTGTYGQTRQGANAYGSWGSTSVQRGDQWATTSRVTNIVTGATTRATQGSGGASAVTRTGSQGAAGVAKTAGGDMYAGRDGNVYRNDGSGWQQYNNGGWNSVNPSVGTSGQRATAADNPGAQARASQADAFNSSMQGQLDNDRAARDEGTQRVSDLGNFGGGGFADRAGSYRPSGGSLGGAGGFRGGGRR